VHVNQKNPAESLLTELSTEVHENGAQQPADHARDEMHGAGNEMIDQPKQVLPSLGPASLV
jgi:hypothetical protein